MAKGFTQIPGIDHQEFFSPVVTDVGLRALFVLYILNKQYVALGLDVETAFLYGDLDEEIYMRVLQGMDLP